MTPLEQFAQHLDADEVAQAAAIAESFHGESTAAYDLARRAVDVRTSDPALSRLSVAALFVMAGDAARALTEAHAAVALNGGIRYRSALGSVLVATEQLEEAVGVLQGVIAGAPDDRDAHMNLATAAFKLGDYGTAMSGYARAFDLDPDDLTPLRNLTAMLEEMGQRDLLVHASKRSPQHQLVVARVLVDVERFAEANKLLHDLARNPALTAADRANMHFIEGLVAENDGYATTALERYGKALAADRSHVDAATNALSLLLENESKDAFAQIARILDSVDPAARAGSPVLAYNEAMYLHRTGATDKALEALERVLALSDGKGELAGLARAARAEITQ